MKIHDALKDRENNFTIMRLLAAYAVLFGHSYPLSLGPGIEDPISRFFIHHWGESLPSLAVDLFFVTSGFLVGASYIQRQNLIVFFEARALRIIPALFIAVLFCIFIVGPFATTLPLSEYFSSTSTWSYLKHNSTLITGIQFDLPGVFVTNPYQTSVNGSLWTLPIEVSMYFWVAILGYLSILKNIQSFNLFFVLICLIYAQSTDNSFFIAHEIRHVHLAFLFMLGTFFYINSKEIPLSFALLAAIAILTYMTSTSEFSLYIKSIFFAYLVLTLALHPKLQLRSIDHWGDISYGLYIYAFPIQQTIAFLNPKVQPLSMFALSTGVTIVLAILSWHLIEKPALKMKGKIPFINSIASNSPSKKSS